MVARRGGIGRVFILGIGMAALGAPVSAEVVLDGTLGTAGALTGPRYAVSAELGRQVGGNLFHSFGEFNLAAGESAIFSGPESVTTILARVTGGHATTIDGQLASSIPKADFFFMNPAGVMFGPHSSVDVTGSFHVTTADYLKFGDGRFEAFHPENTVLASAPVTAFGFINQSPGKVVFSGSGSALGQKYLPILAINDGKGITVPEGATISVVGGEIAIGTGDFLGSPDYPTESRIVAPGGKINLVSVGAAGELPLATMATEGFQTLGAVTLDGKSILDVSGPRGGDIFIRGNRLTVDTGSLRNYTMGDTDGGIIDLGMRGDTILKNDGTIVSATFGGGQGAALILEAENLRLEAGGKIQSFSLGGGRGGDLHIQVEDAVALSGKGSSLPSGIYLTPAGLGDGGTLSLVAHSLRVGEDAMISAINSNPNQGVKAGKIDFTLATLELVAGGKISTLVAGAGAGAPVTITAKDSFLISGNDSYFNGTTNNGSTGKQSDLSVVSDRVTLADGGAIKVGVAGAGQGGTVKIAARELVIDSGATITGNSTGTGDGADLFLTVGENLRLTAGGAIAKSHQGSGREGELVLAVDTGTIAISGNDPRTHNNSGIYNLVSGSGPAGNTHIVARRIDLTESGAIKQTITGGGEGGELSLVVGETLFIAGQKDGNYSGIYAANLGSGAKAGTISVHADTITLRDEGQIFGETVGTGNGAEIVLRTGTLAVAGGRIDASTFGGGKGGNITLQAEKSVLVAGENSTIVTMSTATATGDAGKIVVSTPWLRLNDGALLTTFSQGAGQGGAIEIAAATVELAEKGAINANSYAGGRGGDILLATERLSIQSGAAIHSASLPLQAGSKAGNSGTITVNAQESVSVAGVSSSGLPISSSISTDTTGNGQGGLVVINTPELRVADTGWIHATTTGAGNAGHLQIDLARLFLTGGGQLQTTSTGAGRAGDIQVTAREAVTISGYNYQEDGTQYFSGIRARAKSSGNAGEIAVTTPLLALSDQGQIATGVSEEYGQGGNGGDIALHIDRLSLASGAKITAASSGIGAAGGIAVLAKESVILSASEITTSATNSAGGNILVNANRMLHLDHGAITTAVQGGDGNGGNIEIDPQYVILDHSLISANAYGGNGGNIHLVADTYLADPASAVTASSVLAIAGEIRIESPDTDIAGATALLPDGFRLEAGLNQNGCAARTLENSSSLVVVGRSAELPGERRQAAAHLE